MASLQKTEMEALLDDPASGTLFIDPLLDRGQIGEVTLDLRLGYDFLVSIKTRKPYIETASKNGERFRGIGSYFQLTRREIGERFILYPDQVVLATSLEYVSLPDYIYADVLTRSSYTRLGIHINTMVQPGFRGCFPLELFNHSNNAVELVVGARVIQTRLFRTAAPSTYLSGRSPRKYYGNVRPTVSRAHTDSDLTFLEKIRQKSD